MVDHSRLLADFLSGPSEEISMFFEWVASQAAKGHNDRSHFIMDTRAVLSRGGDPASEIRVQSVPHVAGPLRELLAEWRDAGSP